MTFIYALDPATGKVIWANSGNGALADCIYGFQNADVELTQHTEGVE